MVAYNYGPTWTDRTRAYARNSTRPITGTLLEERKLAFLIDTVSRGPVWVPKSLVAHDAARGVFYDALLARAEKALGLGGRGDVPHSPRPLSAALGGGPAPRA